MSVRAIGINHVALVVFDLEEALAWYDRFFEFELRGRQGKMAWIGLGDQFLALSEGEPGPADTARHVGLVVSDKEQLRAELREAGVAVRSSGSLRVHDPSGNQLEIVDYRDVQFTKTAGVARAMGIEGLEKSAAARDELRAKGLLGE